MVRGRAWAEENPSLAWEVQGSRGGEALPSKTKRCQILVKCILWKWRTKPRNLIALCNGNSFPHLWDGGESSERQKARFSLGIKILCVIAWNMHQEKGKWGFHGQGVSERLQCHFAVPMNPRICVPAFKLFEKLLLILNFFPKCSWKMCLESVGKGQ